MFINVRSPYTIAWQNVAAHMPLTTTSTSVTYTVTFTAHSYEYISLSASYLHCFWYSLVDSVRFISPTDLVVYWSVISLPFTSTSDGDFALPGISISASMYAGIYL